MNRYIWLLVVVIGCVTCKSNHVVISKKTGFQMNSWETQDSLLMSYRSQHKFALSNDLQAIRRSIHEKSSSIFILSPSRLRSWADVPFQNERYRVFLMAPGDYRHLGRLRLKHVASGTARNKKYLIAYNPETGEVWDYTKGLPLDAFPQSIIESFEFSKLEYWVIRGIRVSGNNTVHRGIRGGEQNKIANYCEHLLLDHCILENVVAKNVLNIRFSNRITVQNCIIRNAAKVPKGDNIGIAIRGERAEARDNIIANNEIYNCTDGIQLVYHDRYGAHGFVSGTIIENNDIYLTPDYYHQSADGEFACAENGIDVKIGGATAASEDVVQIIGNRIWGFRKTYSPCGGTGSWGDGIVLHINANNIVVRDNILWDLPNGIAASPSKLLKRTGQDRVNIEISNNVIYDIKKTTRVEKKARAIRANGALISNNSIIDAEIAFQGDQKYATVLQKNLILGDDHSITTRGRITAKDNARPGKRKDLESKGSVTSFSCRIKRLTAPEIREIPAALVTAKRE